MLSAGTNKIGRITLAQRTARLGHRAGPDPVRENESMKAQVLHGHGKIDDIRFESNWPDPVPGPGDVVLKVKACTLNYHDIFTLRGMPGISLTMPLIMGIDATIGEGIPKERYERITYAYADTAKIVDYVEGKADPVFTTGASDPKDIAAEILGRIKDLPMYYTALNKEFADVDFAVFARALGLLHEDGKLWKDPTGRLCVKGSQFDAKPNR